MDQAADPSPSVEQVAAAARDLLLTALEDLTQEQLKRFRHKLRDEPLAAGGRTIPWSRLERADALDLTEQLTQFYGPGPALDVTRRALKRADVRDVAARLKEQRLQQFKKVFREHVLREHAKVREHNARSVKITKRFTKLLIAPGDAEAVRDAELDPEPDTGPGGDLEPPTERARRSDTHTFNRLFGRDETGQRPLSVVLQGPAGIGKTMAARKILYDWAAGKLYRGQVDFAFFLPCRELLDRSDSCSLADLLLERCPGGRAPLRALLARPERLLFILDGADELPTGTRAPCDPFQPAGAATVLSALLGQALLPGARLLLTARAPPGQLSHPQCAEVRGFSHHDRKKFFFKFFADEARAARVYRAVKSNAPLFSLCSVPFVCWLVCSVLHQELAAGRGLASRTSTAVYLLFTAGVLGDTSGPAREELSRLCLLAREGTLGRRSRFPEAELVRRGLAGSRAQLLFLGRKERPGLLGTEVAFQFLDPSVQEFLAALSFLLEEELGAVGPGLGTLLPEGSSPQAHLALTARFLFGLVGSELARDTERLLGGPGSEGLRRQVLAWAQGLGKGREPGWDRGGDGDEGRGDDAQDGDGHGPQDRDTDEGEDEGEDTDGDRYRDGDVDGYRAGDGDRDGAPHGHPLELLRCLHETQEPGFVRQVLGSHPELTLRRLRFSHWDLTVLAYCVRYCPAGQALRLDSCRLSVAPEKKRKSLVRRLQSGLGGSGSSKRKAPVSLLRPLSEAMSDRQCGLSSLTLSGCRMPEPVCRDLAEAVSRAPALTELALLHNTLGDAGLRVLGDGLTRPGCRVRTLRVQQPGLQGALQVLVSMLQLSPALTALDLGGCQLSAPLVSCLCAALRDPGCRLRTLSLGSGELSDQSLKELQAVKKARPSVVISHPALEGQPELPLTCNTVL